MDKTISQSEQSLKSTTEADEGLRNQSFFNASVPKEIESNQHPLTQFIMYRMMRVE